MFGCGLHVLESYCSKGYTPGDLANLEAITHVYYPQRQWDFPQEYSQEGSEWRLLYFFFICDSTVGHSSSHGFCLFCTGFILRNSISSWRTLMTNYTPSMVFWNVILHPPHIEHIATWTYFRSLSQGMHLTPASQIAEICGDITFWGKCTCNAISNIRL